MVERRDDDDAPAPAADSDTATRPTPAPEPQTSGFASKRGSEYLDPCQAAATQSIRCLNRNGGDRDMCGDFFRAYRDCKTEWMAARREARKKEGKVLWWLG